MGGSVILRANQTGHLFLRPYYSSKFKQVASSYKSIIVLKERDLLNGESIPGGKVFNYSNCSPQMTAKKREAETPTVTPHLLPGRPLIGGAAPIMRIV